MNDDRITLTVGGQAVALTIDRAAAHELARSLSAALEAGAKAGKTGADELIEVRLPHHVAHHLGATTAAPKSVAAAPKSVAATPKSAAPAPKSAAPTTTGPAGDRGCLALIWPFVA